MIGSVVLILQGGEGAFFREPQRGQYSCAVGDF